MAFLLIQAVDTLTATNKQEGLYRTLRYLLIWAAALFFSLTALKEENHLLRLFKGLVWVMILQALIGILQFYGIAFAGLPPQANEKPFGLMANRTAFSSGLALLFPFCGYVAYAGKRRWKIISARRIWFSKFPFTDPR